VKWTIVLSFKLILYHVLVPRRSIMTFEAQEEHIVGSMRLKSVWEVSAVESRHNMKSGEVFFAPAHDTFILTIGGVVLIVNPGFFSFHAAA